MKEEFNTSRYIEIPFKNKGRDFDGCDCWGLVRLIYHTEFNIELPSFVDVYKDANESKKISKAITENRSLINYKENEAPEYGDIVVFNIQKMPFHVGVYVGRGMVLHVMRGMNSACERISLGKLKGRVEGFYEIRN